LEYERVYHDFDLEEAQEVLEKATTCHQLEVAQLEGKQTRLLAVCLLFEKAYDRMEEEKKEEEVRVLHACRRWLVLLLVLLPTGADGSSIHHG
jgi:hypothetical protein